MASSSLALTGVPANVERALTRLYEDVGANCAQIFTASKLGYLGGAFRGPEECAYLLVYGGKAKCCGAKAPPPVAPVAPPTAPVAPPPVATPIKPMMMSKCSCWRADALPWRR
jgi:hypothetical protein